MSEYLKKKVVSLPVLFALCVFCLIAGSQTDTSEVKADSLAPVESAFPVLADKKYVGVRMTIDVQNEYIFKIVSMISVVADKNIVVADNVNAKMTLKLEDVPWDQALDMILASQNLEIEESGSVLTVYDQATLQIIKSRLERLKAGHLNNTYRCGPLIKKVFTPQYVPTSRVMSELAKLKSVCGIIIDKDNEVYVEDDFFVIDAMSQVFMRIDRAARQILIEARIIECTPAFAERYDLSRPDDSSEIQTGTNGAELRKSTKDTKISAVILNKNDSLNLPDAIQAARSTSDVRIISAPRIMAANDEDVSIKEGRSGCGYHSRSSASTAANVQFREVIVDLKVKPHIEENSELVSLYI